MFENHQIFENYVNTLLNNLWVKEIIKKLENIAWTEWLKNTWYQNLGDANEAVLTIEFIALNIILENKKDLKSMV